MKNWVILIALIAALVFVSAWLSNTPTTQKRESIVKESAPPKKQVLRKATMTPGRVVELHTVKGSIDFVLFEKDCPTTTANIADLINKKNFDNVAFHRILPNGLIQAAGQNTPMTPIKLEVVKGLQHEKGAIGMARTNDPNSATNSFYILIEPRHDLDYGYAIFGRLIRGMDVVRKIRVGDKIKTATLRPSTPEDKSLLLRSLQIEVDRKND